MDRERLRLLIGPLETRNEHLPEEQGFKVQKFKLVDLQDREIAVAETFNEEGCYSVHWLTGLEEPKLMELVEACIASYEARCPLGVSTLDGGTRKIVGEDIEGSDLNIKGIIYWAKKDGEGFRGGGGYQRPFSWQQILDFLKGAELTYVRVNTPVGDFGIKPDETSRHFGVVSDVSDIEGFVELIHGSLGERVGKEDIQLLLRTAIANFKGQDTV